MNKKILIKNGFVISVCLFLILGATYIYTAHHLILSRLGYNLQVPFIKNSIQCSDNSPDFLYDLMLNLIDKQKSMSNQIVFQRKDGTLYHCESGWEDGFRGDVLLTEDSRFRYASVSKVITSAMVLHLVNEGKLSLDQKLLDVITVPAPKDKRIYDITIGMLLNHSAGFDRLKTYTPMLTMGIKPWCPTNLDKLATMTLDYDPNTQFQYSNVGYCLLGAVVEKTTGQSFREAANEIYQLKDRNIKFVSEGFLKDEIAYDYRYENFYGKTYPKYFDFENSLYAVGGLSGSAKAMVELTRDMLKEQPLNILSTAKMPCTIDKLDGCYGYALLPYQKSGHNFTLYNKSGFFPGINTDIFVDGQGGILALYRGSSSPNFEVKNQLKYETYSKLENYYGLTRK